MLRDRLVLVGPEPPVILRAREERRGRPLPHELVELADVLVRLPRGDPEHRGGSASGRDGDGDHTHAIDRPLRDWIARELAVLRVAPRAFLAGGVLLTDRERRETVRAAAARPRDEEVPASLVVDDRLAAGVVVGGIAGVVAVQVGVEVLEEPDLPLTPERVLDRDLLEIDVAVEVDRVAEAQAQAKLRMHERRVADECLVLVRDVTILPVVAGPGEGAVDPEPEPRRIPDRVVLLTDVRVVDVAQLVARIEGDEVITVAERKIARDRGEFVAGRLVAGG